MAMWSIGRKRARRWGVVLAALTLAGTLAACGGSSAAGDGGGGSSELSGDPIKTMTYASVAYNGPTWENGIIAAKVFEQWINENGGIDGRPLEVVTCDEKGTAPGGEACARQAVAEEVVAVVGTPTYYGSAAESVLGPAGISWFGACCSYGENEFNDPTAFTFAPDPFSGQIAAILAAVDDGCENISAFLPDNASGSSTVQDAVVKVLEANNIDVDVTFTALQTTTTDYSVEAAQGLKNDPDCVVMRVAENSMSALLPAFFQNGSDAQIYSTPGNFGKLSTRGFEDEEQVQNAKLVNVFAPLQSDAFADFREALENYEGDLKDLDYNSIAGLGVWTAYSVFADIVSQMDGEVTSTSFIEAVGKSTVDTGGMTGKDGILDFTKPLTGGIAPFNERIFNRTYFISRYEDGEVLGQLDLQPYVEKVSS